MTRDDVIRMAREAGGCCYEIDWCFEAENLERFAALVAAHEQDRINADMIEYGKSTAEAMREACLAEIEWGIWLDKTTEEILDSIADAIRSIR